MCPLTILYLQEILNQILHEPVLLRHISLKVDHLVQHLLVIPLQVPYVGSHLLLRSRQAVDLSLELSRLGRGGGRRGVGTQLSVGWVGGCGGCGGGDGFSLSGDFAFDIFESVSTLGMEIGMAERPTLHRNIILNNRERRYKQE